MTRPVKRHKARAPAPPYTVWAYRLLRYQIHHKDILGSPNICFVARKLSIFIDSSFRHDYEWEDRHDKLKTKRDYCISKIERSILKKEAFSYTLLYQD